MINGPVIAPDLLEMESALGPYFGDGRRPKFWPDADQARKRERIPLK